MLFLAVIQCLFQCIVGVEVFVIYRFTSDKFNISDTEITPKILNITARQITVEKYWNDDEQIDLVADLPNLTKVWIIDTGQEFPPRFENLPQLSYLHLWRNKITFINKGSISTTQVKYVDFQNNEINKIEKGAIGPNVTTLRLNCNNLRLIKADWFQDPTKLKSFFLVANLIKTIQRDLFANFTNLEDLVLDHNQITTIGPGAFSYRSDFKFFALDNNLLVELNPNIFRPGNITIEHFSIENNNLTFLSIEFMERVNITNIAFTFGNPWQCKCYDMIRKWIRWDVYKKGPDDEPSCVVAQSFANICIPYVESEIITHYKETAAAKVIRKDWCTF